MRIVVHEDTFGITQRALKSLRDELADRIDHAIVVWQLLARDMDHVNCYGFCIIDTTSDEAVIIGDGFRGDGGGEGGAGHRAAQALLSIYRICSMLWDPIDFYPDNDWEVLVKSLELATGGPTVARERNPHYIEHLVRQ